MNTENSYLVALLEERRGYVVRGLKDRVAQVDKIIARYGLAVETEPIETASVENEVETADLPIRKRRRVVKDAHN